MHLQASVEGYDVFARSLSIGAETMVMKFDPDQPMHARYSVDHSFLSADTGTEVQTIGRIVNAFFRWEFNSCETLVRGGEVHPIDYANACPDVAITSLHYYFPWAMKALVKWSIFCTATGRKPRPHVNPAAVVRRSPTAQDLDYPATSSGRTAQLADEHFDTERYLDFCASRLDGFDELAAEYFGGPAFDQVLVDTVRTRRSPPHEREQFTAHFRGLLAAWVADQR